jgi:hypothetical protein
MNAAPSRPPLESAPLVLDEGGGAHRAEEPRRWNARIYRSGQGGVITRP